MSNDSSSAFLPQQLKKELSSVPVYVFKQDLQLRFTWISSGSFGRASDDMLGRTHRDIFPEEEAERMEELKEQILLTGRPGRLTHTLMMDGERHFFDTYLAPQYDEEGNLVELLGVSVDVTDRTAAEEQFRLLVEEVEGYAIFILDTEGRVTTWNRGAEKIKGYREEEIVGQHFSIFHTEADREAGRPEEMLREATREGNVETEGWRVRKDGGQFWARVTLTALFDERGQLRGYSKVTRDMTERRCREKDLQESEQRYRRLFEESQEGITIMSPDGKIIDANPAACELNGYSREELIGMPAARLYEFSEEWERMRGRLEEEGRFRDAEMHLRRKNGEIITCRVAASAVRDADGRIEAFQSYARDITEQRRAQQALKESERKFRELAEQSVMGIVLVQDDLYRYVNPQMAAMLGYTVEELVEQKGPEDLVHPHDWPRVESHLRRCLSGIQSSVRYLSRGVRKDGSVIELEVHGTRIQSGGRPAVLAYMLDITERRQLQREILHIQEEERQRIGQDLHDGVASQLTGVSMILSSIIRDAEQEYPPIADDLARVRQLIREAGEDVRRISRGLNPVSLEEGELPSALERLAQTSTTPDGPSCYCEVEGELPGNLRNVATHLYWIAQEAVTNARKYASASTIGIHLVREGSDMTLSVTDDGKGFDVSEAEKEGLGQRTMRYRAELIGGTLSITSNSDTGTTVRCRVPLDTSSLDE